MVETSGQSTQLRCEEKVTTEGLWCGDGGNIFIISARFRHHNHSLGKGQISQLAYTVLETSLWFTHHSKSCSHGINPSERIQLDLDAEQ